MQWKEADWQPQGLKQLIYRKVSGMATYSGNVNSPEPIWRAEPVLSTTCTSPGPLSPKTGIESPKCWVALAISSCWDHHSCDGDNCLQSAGQGSDPSCKATNVTSASHKHRGVGRGPTSLPVCSAIQFPLPTLSKTAFLMLKGCAHVCESAFPLGESHTTRDLSLSTSLMFPSIFHLHFCNWPSTWPDHRLTKENLFWVSPEIK